jgi:hypothetical protein
MRPTPKVNKRTLPKRKPAKVAKAAAKKAKVKAKFNLKGIPAKYKLICTIAMEHADTQTQCDEFVLVGVSVYETLLEMHPLELADKLKQDAVTKAILLKKETYPVIS